MTVQTELAPTSASLRSASGPCRFCGLAERETAIWADDESSVVASAGSLVPGWLLVVPTEHVLSLAELRQGARLDFARMVAAARESLLRTYESVVEFEHGPSASGKTAGCGVDHAHLHLVPIQIDLRESALGLDTDIDSIEWHSSPWPWDFRRIPGHDYLFVRDNDGQGWIAQAPSIPSQLFRRVIARALGQAHWDWKDPKTRDERHATRAALTNDFRSRHEFRD